MKTKRVGKFVLTRQTIDDLVSKPEWANTVFNNLLVFYAQPLFHIDSVEYHAYSPLFDEVEEGHIVPEYLITINMIGGEINNIVWTRLDE